MFFTYLRRELRRRIRQAIFIALGLAIGIGLVITVTAASAGVRNAQSTVLHALYGVGTDITVTQAPAAGSGEGGRFGFRGVFGSGRPKAGTKIRVDTLVNRGLGTLNASSVSTIAKSGNVAAVAGGLTLTDTVVTGTIPGFSASGPGGFGGGNGGNGGGGGRFRGFLTPSSFTVDGVDLPQGALGPLSSGKLAKGRTFTSTDAGANVAVVDSNYATQKKLGVGSTLTIAKKKFTVIGIVQEPQGDNPSDAYIPLARAQSLASPSLTGKINTIYVAATSSAQIGAVSREVSRLLPKATVTTSSDLASEVTGSLASASSLANNLGKWLAIAVLAAAFGLASLLTIAAVSRRGRGVRTPKAGGWGGRRRHDSQFGPSSDADFSAGHRLFRAALWSGSLPLGRAGRFYCSRRRRCFATVQGPPYSIQYCRRPGWHYSGKSPTAYSAGSLALALEGRGGPLPKRATFFGL